MGGKESKQNKRILPLEEIEKISKINPSIEQIFNKYKNAKGVINYKDLEAIFNWKLNFKIVKKLFKICQIEKEKFDLKDFKYLYSLFLTKNYEAKLSFITDLIFVRKSFTTPEKYKNKVHFLFANSQELSEKLLNPEFIRNITDKENKIFKENFSSILDKQFKNFIKEFSFLIYEEEFPKPNEGNSENQEIATKLVLSTNFINCECEVGNGVKTPNDKNEVVNKNFDMGVYIIFNKFFLIIEDRWNRVGI